MFHISWWFCLFGLVVLTLLYLVLKTINIILLYSKVNKKVYEKAESICGTIYFYFHEKYSTPIILVPIVLILINNSIVWINNGIKQTNFRIETNRTYLINCGIKYHYYRLKAFDPTSYGDSVRDLYLYSEKDINTLLNEKYIKLNNGGYVKVQSIVELSLDEFVQKYDVLIKK